MGTGMTSGEPESTGWARPNQAWCDDAAIRHLADLSEELVPKMQSALASGRADQLTRMANLLKGAARREDCLMVYNIAALLESMGVNNSLREAQVTLAILKTELHRLMPGTESRRSVE
ncbi:hypothetical protein GF377_00885 [candidate division GN15 bacterium]|nr:hypothetical protein [candidate division GN15 bacterium]